MRFPFWHTLAFKHHNFLLMQGGWNWVSLKSLSFFVTIQHQTFIILLWFWETALCSVEQNWRMFNRAELVFSDAELNCRCSWMCFLITPQMLNDPQELFHNNQALVDSILDKGGDKYIPIYENREEMKNMGVKSYIKVCLTPCS